MIILIGTSGVEVGTELIWDYVQEYDTPVIFVINQLDHLKANFENTLEQTVKRFGSKVIPIQFPYNHESGSFSIIDTLRMTMYVYPSKGGKPKKEPIPIDEMPKAAKIHNTLVEIAAENEDGLMEKYFENGSLDESDLAKGLTIALAKQEFYPIFCASAEQNKGSGRIMGFINDIAPSPMDRPTIHLENDEIASNTSESDAKLFIYKTLTKPQVGRVSYFKVYGGTIRSGDSLHNLTNDETERLSHIFETEGKSRTAIDHMVAGDLGVTLKLKDSHTNDTLGTKSS